MWPPSGWHIFGLWKYARHQQFCMYACNRPRFFVQENCITPLKCSVVQPFFSALCTRSNCLALKYTYFDCLSRCYHMHHISYICAECLCFHLSSHIHFMYVSFPTSPFFPSCLSHAHDLFCWCLLLPSLSGGTHSLWKTTYSTLCVLWQNNHSSHSLKF